MTFAEDLARVRQRKDIVLSIAIDGIPVVFMERAVGTLHSSSTGRTQCVCLASIVEGETVLNLRERREEAPTLALTLRDPDGTLADLFAVARFRTTYLDADLTASSTSVTVGDPTGIVAGDHIYIDDETITLGTLSVSTYASCTRGAFGSTATQHEDDSAAVDGASIFTSPPSWIGRRAKLVGYTLAPDGVSVLNSAVMGTFVVDSTPRHEGDSEWSIQLAGAMQDFMGRSVGVGLRETRLTDTAPEWTTDDQLLCYVHDALAFRLGTGVTSYAIVDGASKSAIFRVDDVDLSPYSLTLAFPPLWDSASLATTTNDAAGQSTIRATLRGTIRPVGIIGGPSPIPILSVLISDEGQGASTHDRLPGRKPTFVGDLGWRIGAAIAPALIDTATWEALTGLTNTTLIIDDERPLGDVLREWCLLNDAIVSTTTDGLLTVRRLTERSGTPTTLGDEDVVPGQVKIEALEEDITPTVVVKCGYSPQDREFRSTLTLTDTELAKRYPRSVRRDEVEIRSVDSADTIRPEDVDGNPIRWIHPSAMPTGELQQMIVEAMRGASYGGPRRLVRLTTTMVHYDLRVGDSVTLALTPAAYADAPDMRGGTLLGESGRVVGRRPDYARGTIDLAIELVDQLVHVLPAAVIASASGAVMTLATTGDEVASATPENDFYVNAYVLVVDRSASSVEEFTISSIASSPPRLTLSGTPTFTIQAGVDYVILVPVTPGTTATGYANTEMCLSPNFGEEGDRFG